MRVRGNVWVALLAGSVAFVVIVTLFFATRYGGQEPVLWRAGDLAAVGVTGQLRDGTLWLPAGQDVRWVITTGPQSLEPSERPLVWLELPGLRPVSRVRLFWRTVADPDTFHSVPVDATPGGRAALSPAGHPGWTGTVRELGLLVTGDVPEPLGIDVLRVGAPSPVNLWPTVLTQWWSFRPWRQASINHLARAPRGLLLPVVPAAALWVGLVLAAWWFSGGRGGRRALAVLLAAWLVLDLRWQADLLFKLDETRWLYAGRSTGEKYSAGPDAALYHLAEALRPELTGRVFVTSDEPERVRRYKRRRLHYFLLPANAYSEEALPPAPDRLRPGDLIVALEPHAGLRFEAGRGELRWGAEARIAADPVAATEAGRAWRVRHEETAP